MPSLLNIIKQAALDANDATNPLSLKYGTVTNNDGDPLEITITSTFVLPKELLIVPQSLKSSPLKKGDRVALLREQGGRQYFILDRF